MTVGDMVKDAIDNNVLRFDSELFIQCLSAQDQCSAVSIAIDRTNANQLVPDVPLVSMHLFAAYHNARFDGFREIVREALEHLIDSFRRESPETVTAVFDCWRTLFPGEEPRLV